MARSDFIKRMVETHQSGDAIGFREAAEELVRDERRMKHSGLADDLERILDNRSGRRPLSVSSLKALPQTRDDKPLLSLGDPRRSFRDLVLAKPTRDVLDSVVAEFSERTLLAAHGLQPRSRLLFVGPPGCGKSVAAEAVASQLGFPIARVQLATVVSSFLGDTSRNLESILDFASTGNWVLLFDEFDMLAKERGDQSEHGELRRVVAALLQMLDDFEGDSVVIATSNHPSLLDDAVWRRFDDVVVFRPPTQAQIAELFRVKLRGQHVDFNRREAARQLKGATHAEVEMACFAAARQSVLSGADVVGAKHIEHGVGEVRRRRTEVARYLNRAHSSKTAVSG